MVTIDLTAPAPAEAPSSAAPAGGLLEALPRRVALTLPELQLVARLAGGAPLPFEVADAPAAAEPADTLAGRLGRTPGSAEEAARARAIDSLHDPEETLRRRGLVGAEGLDPHLAGAVGLLATPALALDIDLAVAATQVKAWHRQADGAVATLATCDGLVFELAWFSTRQWRDELGRVAVLPEDLPLGDSQVPATLDCPFPLLDGVGEALRSGRTDLVPVLVAQHDDVRDGDRRLEAATAAAPVTAVHSEGRGRLRVLVAEVTDGRTTDVGVLSWVLLADGWHSLRPHQEPDGAARVTVRRVAPDDLAAELAPVLAEVIA